jgi:hypothetical protein
LYVTYFSSFSPIASQCEEKADLNCNAHSSNQVQLESTNLIQENKTYKVRSSPVLMTSEDVKNSLPPYQCKNYFCLHHYRVGFQVLIYD